MAGEVCHVALTDAAGRFRRYKIGSVVPTGWGWRWRCAAGIRLPALQQSFNPLHCGSISAFVSAIIHRSATATGRRPIRRAAPPLPVVTRRVARDAGKCDDSCAACVDVCPTVAIAKSASGPLTLDLGRCIFCAECVETCPTGAISQTGDHRMAVSRREDLVLGGTGREEVRLASALDEKLRGMFGRSLRLRQVSAGGCNGCEADVTCWGRSGGTLMRFGIQSSPAAAPDGLQDGRDFAQRSSP
jgi:Fe-S-cluster-containing hydrogenase component 2